jgi:YibE/F-like protein
MVARALSVLVLLLVAATATGVILLWPEDREIPRPPELGPAPDTEKAEVVGVRAVPCGLGVGRDDCLEVSAELRSGPDEGDEVMFTFAAAEGEFDVGDDVRVLKNAPLEAPPDTLGEGIEIEPYSFSDFERRTPMLGLVVMFVALVLLTGRWQGLRALLGLGGSLAVIVFFIVPAILDGRSPTAVAFVGALAIMLITLPLAHGVGPKTIAASLGTAASLSLTLVLGYFFIDLTHLSGVSSEEGCLPARDAGRALAARPPPRRNGHCRARRARRPHRFPVLDRDGAEAGEP